MSAEQLIRLFCEIPWAGWKGLQAACSQPKQICVLYRSLRSPLLRSSKNHALSHEVKISFSSHCPSQSALVHWYHVNKAPFSLHCSTTAIDAPHSGQSLHRVFSGSLTVLIVFPNSMVTIAISQRILQGIVHDVGVHSNPVLVASCSIWYYRTSWYRP